MADYIVLVIGIGPHVDEVLRAVAYEKSWKLEAVKTVSLIIGQEDAPETVYVYPAVTDEAKMLVAKLAAETGGFLKPEAGLPKFEAGDDVLLVQALPVRGNAPVLDIRAHALNARGQEPGASPEPASASAAESEPAASGWQFGFDMITTE